MNLEREIREMLGAHTAPDPRLFEGLIDGSEVAVSADDLLGIILKQSALEQAVMLLAQHVDRLQR